MTTKRTAAKEMKAKKPTQSLCILDFEEVLIYVSI
jgi:hypothetical protein